MAAGTDSNREPCVRALDAAAVRVRHLSADGKSLSRHAAAEVWDRTVHQPDRVFYRGLDFNSAGCRRETACSLADFRVRVSDRERGDGVGHALGIRLHPSAEKNEVAR